MHLDFTEPIVSYAHNFVYNCPGGLYVLDCAHLCLLKDHDISSIHRSLAGGSSIVPSSRLISLDHFLGTESEFELDSEKHVLSLICRHRIVTLAFHNQQTAHCWQAFIDHILRHS